MHPLSSRELSEENGQELNITVSVRCRGRNEREIKAKSSVVVTVPDVTGSNEVSINTTDELGITAQMNSKTYTVDKVFGPSADQSLIFKQIAEPLFDDFIKGYNCTVLVYGMTSTGKTYTMTGDERLYDGELSDAAGIIPRILFKLFDTLETQDEDYLVKCSFIELYNEELKDLLNEPQESGVIKKLRIFDSNTVSSNSRNNSRNNSPNLVGTSGTFKRIFKTPVPYKQQQQHQQHQQHLQQQQQQPRLINNKQQSLSEQSSAIYIQNLQEFHITNAKDGIDLLQRGLKHRQVASTKMNDFSSRSHTIFTIMLYKNHNGEVFRVSKMNLVDLAGSENISRSGAQNQRAKEAGSINQSLLTLGRVINSLADKNAHIPFRESKLTRLLQDSLGGNTKTALIATISPAKINAEETSSTLEYATKAKNIKNKPQLGTLVMKDILVKNITRELAKIKSDFLSTKSKDGIYMTQDHYRELTNDLENYKTEVQECKREIEKMNSQNVLLLKDKRASHEVSELQRIKIKHLNDKIAHLYDKMDKQHKNEQDLVCTIYTLKDAIYTVQNSLKNCEDYQLQCKSEMEDVLYDHVTSFKQSIHGQLAAMKASHSSKYLDIDGNIDIIQEELSQVLESICSASVDVCRSCVEKILESNPKHFESIRRDLLDISTVVDSYSNELVKNLGDISEEYNNFREYLNEHLFKNNHEETLSIHVDKTYHMLKKSAGELFSKFKEMMDSHLEENKSLMIKSLKTASDEVVAKEVKLFAPVKQKWESSLENINKCDSLNNTFDSTVKDALRRLEGNIEGSLEFSKNTAGDVKDSLKKFDGISEVLKNNTKVVSNIKEVKEKHTFLRDQIERTSSYIEAANEKFEGIDQFIRQIIDKKLPTHLASNGELVNGMLEQLGKTHLKPIGSASRTPSSRSVSPMKMLDNNIFNGISPSKRKIDETENDRSKSQRIE